MLQEKNTKSLGIKKNYIPATLVGILLLAFLLIKVYYSPRLLSLFCVEENNYCSENSSDNPLMISFKGDDRYFPTYVFQERSPLFFWYTFVDYNKDIWGDNFEGRALLDKESDVFGKLILEEGQMIWLLYRLRPGTVEFRWLEIEEGTQGEELDKYFGFGDPGEGFFAGFRFRNNSEGVPTLYVETINFGHTETTIIKMDPTEKPRRYFVKWDSAFVRYRVGNSIITHKKSLKTAFDIPGVMMEISVHNIKGGGNLILPLAKYDAF